MVLDSRDALLANLGRIREKTARACERVGRDPSEVLLVGATKAVPPELVRWAYEAGVTDFGENYVQELRTKREAVSSATWHFIGTLQSHTVHHVAELADVVETLARGRSTARLARRAAERGRRIPALIEIDFTGERSGVAPEDCLAFSDEVAELEGLELVGLMTVPPLVESPQDSRPHFRRLRALRDEVAARHPDAAHLSMGMSMDYEVAVEEGATMVRIGTALFGERPPTT
jgi:pyridoxal phosphate enzyme (YggS family)